MSPSYRLFGCFRLLLALVVVLQHSLRATAPAAFQAWMEPFEFGNVAVLTFFTVSAFIITEAVTAIYPGRPLAFITNRFVRIYPTYILALIVTATLLCAYFTFGNSGGRLEGWAQVPDMSAKGLAVNAFAILPGGRWLLQSTGVDFVLYIAWALQIQLFFYFLMLMFMVIAERTAFPISWVLAGSATLAMGAYAIALPVLRGGGFEYIPYFVLGAAICHVTSSPVSSSDVPSSVGRRSVTAIVLTLTAAALIVVHMLGRDPIHPDFHYARELTMRLVAFTATIAVWLGLVVVSASSTRLPRSLVAWDRLLGALTFPLYLFHIPALILTMWLVQQRSGMALLTGMIASLAVAWLVYEQFDLRVAKLRNVLRGFALGPASPSSATAEETGQARSSPARLRLLGRLQA